MGFREQVKTDLEQVFLNCEEFAEPHRIEGKTVHVVIDSNVLKEKNQAMGIVGADLLVMGKKEDFPDKLSPGNLLNVDGREMLVADVKEDMGMVEAALIQNRHG